MASKRGAGNELTDRNWDHEDEPEEAGSFKQADETAIKARVIKTARRRGVSAVSGSSSAFSGFAGFGGAAAAAPKPSVNFSFGSVVSTPTHGTKDDAAAPVEDAVADSTTSEATSKEHSNGSAHNDHPADEVKPSSSEPERGGASTDKKKKSGEEKARKAEKEHKYLAYVKTLNKSVIAWIQKHVEDKPACILTPVFDDYEKHLKKIEDKFGVGPSDTEDSDPEVMSSPASGDVSEHCADDSPTAAKEGENGENGKENGKENGEDAGENGAGEVDTFSATKTRYTSTVPSQSTAARGGLDASLKEINSKDHTKGEEKSEDQLGPKLNSFSSFSATKTTHTFSFSNLSHTRAPTSSCNSSMKPTFSFCVSSGADTKPSVNTSSSTSTSVYSNAGLFNIGQGSSSFSSLQSGAGEPNKSTTEANKGLFSFGKDTTMGKVELSGASSTSATETNKGVFTFGGQSSSTATSSSGSSFSFGASTFGGMSSTFGANSFGGNASKPGGFSFGGGTNGFSALGCGANGASSTTDDAKTTGDDEEYVPPKPEVTQISEDDALFTKRCKLFFKKDGGFVDRGIGNLFIKPLAGDDEGEKSKHSLLVRADTNLGNILLNISINSLKFTALGNKDISFLCIPNPLPDPKMSPDTPVVMLLRVKDAEIRDEVLEQLTSHS